MPLILEYYFWRLEYLFWWSKMKTWGQDYFLKVEHCFRDVLEISDKHPRHFIGEYPIGICIAQCSCSFSLVLVTKDEPQYKINRTKNLKLHCRKQCKKGKKKEIDNSLWVEVCKATTRHYLSLQDSKMVCNNFTRKDKWEKSQRVPCI